MVRSEREIQKAIDDLDPDVIASGSGSQWPGMTYEQGVDNALRWALGGSDHPMDE